MEKCGHGLSRSPEARREAGHGRLPLDLWREHSSSSNFDLRFLGSRNARK